jgi:PAS domain S-box-containing protein
MPTERHDRTVAGDDAVDDELRALEKAQEGLATANEELAVANEELRVQQDELLAQQQQLQQQNAALQAERQRYRELFELAPDAYLVTDLQGVIREANEAASTLLAVPAQYATGKPLPMFVPGPTKDGLWRHLSGLGEGKVDEVRNWETAILPRRGEPVDVLVSMVPARSPEGEVTGVRWLVRDITERKAWERERERLMAEQVEAEKALRVSMEKYKVLVESFPLGITVTDEQGRIVEANRESERLLGLSQEAHRGRDVDGAEWQIVRLDGSPMPPEEYASVRALREGRQVDDVEMGIVRGEGEITWISVTAAPVPVEGYGVAVAYGDISERVQAEGRLRSYAERLRLQHQTDQAILSARSAEEMVEAVLRRLPRLLPCLRAGVNLLDPEAGEVWLLATYSAGETSLDKGWRAPVAESLGASMEQLARGERYLVDDMQALEPWSPLAAQLQEEGVRAEVLQPLIVQGELIGALGIGMTVPGPLPEEQLEAVGELADALAVGIQQMRLYEEVQRYAAELEQRVQLRTAELAASEARFRAVYEQAAIGIAVLDQRGRILSSNPALQQMLGYSAHALTGLLLSTLADGPYPTRAANGGREDHPHPVPSASGGEDHPHPVPSASGGGERGAPPVGAHSSSPPAGGTEGGEGQSGRVQSPAPTEREGEDGGHPTRAANGGEDHPHPVPTATGGENHPHPTSPSGGGERGTPPAVADALHGGAAPSSPPSGGTEGGQGGTGAAALSSPPSGVAPEALPAPGQRDALQGGTRSSSPPSGGTEGGQGGRGGTEGGRAPSRTEQRYRRSDGTLVEANVTTSPIQLGEGEPPLYVALIEDVTEANRAQEALRQSEQLALTGRLAASVAHEIGNPLQAVIGCLALAEEARAGGEDPARYMALAMDELDRAARLVGRMRDLNRRTEGEREPVDVNAVVERVLLLSQKQCETHGVAVHWEAGADLPSVSAVPDRVQQVFLNLVLNAVDAMPEGGELTVRTAATLDPRGIEATFADTGRGIPEKQLARLFEPFASTKTQGLGLGLYVSRNIVHDHGGHIEADSHAGQGTTFTVWLPAR